MGTRTPLPACERCGEPCTTRRNRFCSYSCRVEAITRGPRPIERFWARVDKAGPVLVPELGPCWVWTGMTDKDGYGLTTRGGVRGAHRVAWVAAHGAIPPGHHVCHRCDNPSCTNTEGHLFLATHDENMADRNQKGRQARGVRLPAHVLDDAKAAAIYRRYHAGGTTQQQLADEYGVTRTAIGYVTQGRRWQHATSSQMGQPVCDPSYVSSPQ